MSESDSKVLGGEKARVSFSNILGVFILGSAILYLIFSHAFSGNIEKILIYAKKTAEMLG